MLWDSSYSQYSRLLPLPPPIPFWEPLSPELIVILLVPFWNSLGTYSYKGRSAQAEAKVPSVSDLEARS
ncbi:hypothetical protein K503DRAFT_806804 [Rhizopogon vinicolor AM-OR11-026]|uniref:Uncharacterized protein n=1 Tax=Rhizopogon vinicolor AM-OR11-026 TaxID=1314800 RepID=A0A1B7MDR6_9AGAM|nr:hypothetical protein K503DRAFT_806804 [Rhizopogon vinicolor AM-OR11-026]